MESMSVDDDDEVVALTERGANGLRDPGQEVYLRDAERWRRSNPPEVEEPPAAKAIVEDRGRYIADPIVTQKFPPHATPGDIAIGGRDKRGSGFLQGGPPVDGSDVFQTDQFRKLR